MKNDGDNGFTLIEAVSVVAILSILAGISIPAIGKWVKLNKISEAKALASAAALECLQGVRQGNDPETLEIEESVISNDRLLKTGYQLDAGKTKCNEFNISPIDENEKVLYPLGFRISSDGKIAKLAIPAADQSSLNSCKQWAGTNCGISPEQQAEWDRQAAIAKAKSDCNEKFYDWLKNTKPNGGSGTKSRWDSKSTSCSLNTWAFEGSIQQSEDEYKAAEQRKYGKICSEKTAEKKAEKTTGGPYTIAECGAREFYFCLGEDKSTLEDMNACIANNAEAKCESDREAARTSNHKGKYGPKQGPGVCGEVKWLCNGTMVDTEALYLETVCGKTETCSDPNDFHWICGRYPTHRKCIGYIPCK